MNYPTFTIYTGDGNLLLPAPTQRLQIIQCANNIRIFIRSVSMGVKPPLKIFRPTWKNVLDIVLKFWVLLRKLFAPPGVPSWLRALFLYKTRSIYLLSES